MDDRRRSRAIAATAGDTQGRHRADFLTLGSDSVTESHPGVTRAPAPRSPWDLRHEVVVDRRCRSRGLVPRNHCYTDAGVANSAMASAAVGSSSRTLCTLIAPNWVKLAHAVAKPTICSSRWESGAIV
jgi:hypothetical protein